MSLEEFACGLARIGAEDLPLLDITARSEARDKFRSLSSVELTRQEKNTVLAHFCRSNVTEKEEALPKHQHEIVNKLRNMVGSDMGYPEGLPRIAVGVPGPRKKERGAIGLLERIGVPTTQLWMKRHFNAGRADSRIVGHLISRYESDPESSDIPILVALSPAAHINDAMEITARAPYLQEWTWSSIKVSAVAEMTVITNDKSVLTDIEDDHARTSIICILDELEGHDVIALQTGQVRSDVA